MGSCSEAVLKAIKMGFTRIIKLVSHKLEQVWKQNWQPPWNISTPIKDIRKAQQGHQLTLQVIQLTIIALAKLVTNTLCIIFAQIANFD